MEKEGKNSKSNVVFIIAIICILLCIPIGILIGKKLKDTSNDLINENVSDKKENDDFSEQSDIKYTIGDDQILDIDGYDTCITNESIKYIGCFINKNYNDILDTLYLLDKNTKETVLIADNVGHAVEGNYFDIIDDKYLIITVNDTEGSKLMPLTVKNQYGADLYDIEKKEKITHLKYVYLKKDKILNKEVWVNFNSQPNISAILDENFNLILDLGRDYDINSNSISVLKNKTLNVYNIDGTLLKTIPNVDNITVDYYLKIENNEVNIYNLNEEFVVTLTTLNDENHLIEFYGIYNNGVGNIFINDGTSIRVYVSNEDTNGYGCYSNDSSLTTKYSYDLKTKKVTEEKNAKESCEKDNLYYNENKK